LQVVHKCLIIFKSWCINKKGWKVFPQEGYGSNKIKVCKKRDFLLKVLMLGWEFPPFFAGGAGIVCNELARALVQVGADVTFIMPSGPEEIYDKASILEPGKPQLKIIVADNTKLGKGIKIRKINSLLTAYGSESDYEKSYNKIMQKQQAGIKPLYGKNLLEEVYRFAEQVAIIAQEEEFDVIHAQDWVTYLAAIKLKRITGKPMVVHVHITEFDKSGGLHADSRIYDIEKQGMDEADKIIAISNFVKERCVRQYFQDPNKIVIVHNAAVPMN
jgi:glycogen synthase